MNVEKNFFLILSGFLSWAKLFAGRILTISPYRFLHSIFLSLVAQLAMVVSFFLPLKVVFLLGSDQIPSYFGSIFHFSSIAQLIAVLVVLSALSYFLFLAANRYSEVLSAEGARKVVEATSKLTLFQNQEELALRSYLRIGNVLAALLFLLFSLTVFSVFYSTLFFIFLFCSLLLVGFLYTLFSVRPRLLISAESNPGPFVSQIYGIFFIVVFCFMVIDLLLWSDVNFYVSLVCLLLVRQLLQRLTTASIDAVLLARQKDQVNSIFFSNGHKGAESLGLNRGTVTSLLSENSLFGFVKKVFYCFDAGSYNSGFFDGLKVDFIQSSIIDVITLLVCVEGDHYIVKVFDKRHEFLAIRESDLILNDSSGLVCSIFKVLESVDGFRVHVFHFSVKIRADSRFDFKKRRDLFRLRCFNNLPNKDFLDRYNLSHPYIWDRIHGLNDILHYPMFNKLFRTCSIDQFIRLSEEYLKNLPLVFCPVDVTNDALVVLENDVVTSFHWERWSFEPMGFGLTLSELAPSHLRWLLDQSDFSSVDESKVRLSGLFSLLEQQIKNQKLRSAENTLASIIETLERLTARSGTDK